MTLRAALEARDVGAIAAALAPALDRDAGPLVLGALDPRPGDVLRALDVIAESGEPDAERASKLARSFGRVVRAWLPGRAIAIAATAHEAQRDKADAPYALHPMRLALRATSADELAAAALHDVVEDTPWTLDRLASEGFSERVLAAIDALTKRDGESYEVFLERVLVDRLAMRVKLWDLEDNLDLKRLPTLAPADLARVEKYHRARRRLERALEAPRHEPKGKLTIELLPESRARVRALAIHSEIRADHVTLKHGFDRPFDAAWIPAGRNVGDVVGMRATGIADDGRVQALVVEILGSSRRPSDGGTLHVTISRKPWARSRDSNTMLLRAKPEPVDLVLEGVVVRDDDG